MLIGIDEDDKNFVLTPSCDAEEKTLRQMAAILSCGERLSYNGRTGDGADGYFRLRFYAGATPREETKGVVTRTVYDGGVLLELYASGEEDMNVLCTMRDISFMGQGIHYVRIDDDEDGFSMVCCGGFCSVCEKPVIDFTSSEWDVCESCVESCEHEYKRGVVRGPGMPIGMGKFCTKCGRGKLVTDEDRKKTPAEHAAEVTEETGIMVSDTPKGALSKLMERIRPN